MSWHEDDQEARMCKSFMLCHHRFIWQRSKEHIYPVKEIIFACYYNRNETETVLAGQLKQASSKIIRDKAKSWWQFWRKIWWWFIYHLGGAIFAERTRWSWRRSILVQDETRQINRYKLVLKNEFCNSQKINHAANYLKDYISRCRSANYKNFVDASKLQSRIFKDMSSISIADEIRNSD